MNWKAEAKDKLRKYDAMKMATINIPEDIARLESEYSAIRSARTDSTPIHGGTSTREDALINNITERQELAQALQNATAWVRIVDRALKCLQQDDRKILHRLYIYPEKGALQRLCSELGVESSSVYRRRDQALQMFTLALYGETGEEPSKGEKKTGRNI